MTERTGATRRHFLQVAVAGAAGWAVSRGSVEKTALADENVTPRDKQRPLKLAMASYTLRRFSLDDALAMTKRLALTAINLKSFHLPLDATKEQIAAARKKISDAGLTLYGGGVIAMKNEQQVNQAFQYAQAAGMVRIIIAPSEDMLPLINEKIQQYGIQACIHNHGPGDKHFPTPDVAYEKIKNLDPRFGLCHDIGHTARYGKDPVKVTEQCADRIFDVHIKDVTAPTKKGHATPCGRGIIDIPALLKTLIQVGYKGYLAFEYEADSNDPLPGVAESVGYVRGVLDTL